MARRLTPWAPVAALLLTLPLLGTPHPSLSQETAGEAAATSKGSAPEAEAAMEGDAPAAPAIPKPANAASLLKRIEAGEFKDLGDAEMRAALEGVDPGIVIDAGLLLLKQRPEYVVTLNKRETVRGDYLPADVIRVSLRRTPMAIFARYIGGPYKGREILYDHATRPGQITVAEAGILGLMTLNIDVDSSLTKRSTNHNVTELGLEYPLSLMERDLKRLKAAGMAPDLTEGRVVKQGGRSLWELKVKTPGPPDYYAHHVRIGFDLSTGLVMVMEVGDASGKTIEYFEYSDLRFLAHPANTFDPKNPDYRF